MRRIAILPANILIPDSSAAWLRSGLPVVFQNDLETATQLAATLVDGQSQAYQVEASQVLRASVELRNQQWRIRVVTIDLSSQMVVDTFVVTEPEPDGVIGAADEVAKHLDAHASVFSTRSEKALQAYVQGIAANGAGRELKSRITELQSAIELDPGFGLAYLSAIDAASPSNPATIHDLLEQASIHRGRFTPLDQARFDAVYARLSHQSLSVQAAASAALLKVTPNSLDALVSLASLRFLQGDSPAGQQLLRRALSLSPGNGMVRSYLALGFAESKRFREAETVYRSLEGSPETLPQLAICVLLEGDTARADGIFARYLKPQETAGEAAVALIHANWLAISGRLPEAVTLLKSSRFASPDLQSLASSQSAIWELMRHDTGNAKADAAAALRISSSPPAKALAIAANAIVSGGKTPESLRNQISGVALSADQKSIVLAYGLFLDTHYAEAADAWRALLVQSGGTDLRSRAMLAASLNRAGKPSEPGALPVLPFIPNVTSSDQFAAVAFSEMRRLLSR